MSTRTHIGCLVTAIAAAVATPRPAAGEGFVLIANAKAAPASESKAEVRALYTGKAKTLEGTAVIVVIRGDDDAVFTGFVDQVFGIPAQALLSKIKQEVFKGEMAKPVKATSDDDVVHAVGATPGTIGVISAGAAGHLPGTVKVIAIGA